MTRLEDRQVVLAGYLTAMLHVVGVNLREYVMVPQIDGMLYFIWYIIVNNQNW